jgi:DNA-binding response OmpR family regulator
LNDDRTLHSGDPASARFTGATHQFRRILVVDDDVSIRELNTDLLIHSGYAVDVAEDGAIAWATMQRNNYDLLITDQNMPKVTGLELVKKLRAAHMALPVILATGAVPTDELNRHPGLQLAATLAKPYTTEQLLGTVREVLHATGSSCKQIAPPPDLQH